MGVDRRALAPVRHTGECVRVAHLVMDDVLPQGHAEIGRVGAGRGEPGCHLGHGAAVDHLDAEDLFQPMTNGGNRCARLARANHDLEPEFAGVDLFVLGNLGEMEGVGRRVVDGTGLGHLEPARGDGRLAGGTGAEGKALRAHPLRAQHDAPGADIEAEQGGDEDDVARPGCRSSTSPAHGRWQWRPSRRGPARRWSGARWCPRCRGCDEPQRRGYRDNRRTARREVELRAAPLWSRRARARSLPATVM